MILTESSLEKLLVRSLLADRRVFDVQHQALEIIFLGDDGNYHTHTVDVVATLHDGTKVGYIVKPEDTAVSKNTRGLVERLAASVLPTRVSRLQLVTSRNLPEWGNLNARQILNALRDHRTVIDDIIREIAPELTIPVRIGDLTERLGGGRVAFRPVMRAIHFGTLDFVGFGRIDRNGMVLFSGQVMPDTHIDAARPDIYADSPPVFRRRLRTPKPHRRASFRKV